MGFYRMLNHQVCFNPFVFISWNIFVLISLNFITTRLEKIRKYLELTITVFCHVESGFSVVSGSIETHSA